MLLGAAPTAWPCLLAPAAGGSPGLYRRRGDRCEGMVPQNYVVEGDIKLMAFFQGDPTVAARNGSANVVKIADAAGDRAVRQIVIRTTASTGRAFNYLMDTYVLGAEYRWPADLLSERSFLAGGSEVPGLRLLAALRGGDAGRPLLPRDDLARRRPLKLAALPSVRPACALARGDHLDRSEGLIYRPKSAGRSLLPEFSRGGADKAGRSTGGSIG